MNLGISSAIIRHLLIERDVIRMLKYETLRILYLLCPVYICFIKPLFHENYMFITSAFYKSFNNKLLRWRK